MVLSLFFRARRSAQGFCLVQLPVGSTQHGAQQREIAPWIFAKRIGGDRKEIDFGTNFPHPKSRPFPHPREINQVSVLLGQVSVSTGVYRITLCILAKPWGGQATHIRSKIDPLLFLYLLWWSNCSSHLSISKTEFGEFFIYPGFKSFVGCVICKHFLLICDLSFIFLIGFHRIEILNFVKA